jgi:putative N-acetyltransferase (TIGR04045 family)
MKDILCKLVATPQELRAAYKVRREIFVKEQKLFSRSDRDTFDSRAIHIVALLENEVVGTVRVYERDSGVWFGSRLAVQRPFRGRVGVLLVQKAIETVQGRGAKQFFAYVQLHTVSFFKRRRWKPVGEPVDYHGQPHQLMEAQL